MYESRQRKPTVKLHVTKLAAHEEGMTLSFLPSSLQDAMGAMQGRRQRGASGAWTPI